LGFADDLLGLRPADVSGADTTDLRRERGDRLGDPLGLGVLGDQA
jgi:hypothetical protein